MHKEIEPRVGLQRKHQLLVVLMTKEKQYERTKGEHMIPNWKEVESSLSKPGGNRKRWKGKEKEGTGKVGKKVGRKRIRTFTKHLLCVKHYSRQFIV